MKQLKDNTNYCVYNANWFDSEKKFKIKKKKKDLFEHQSEPLDLDEASLWLGNKSVTKEDVRKISLIT